MALPDITVIICAYTLERWSDLTTAVAGVQAQTYPARQLIVVIDHNPELWRRAVAAFPACVVLENADTRGLSGARNTGLRAAQGEVVAFMDEDAVPAPDWLEWLSRGYADARVLGVGGVIAPQWAAQRPRWFPEEFDWVVGCTYRGLPETPAPVRNLIGCNMSLRRELFEQIGGFREGLGRVGRLPVGCEETELCIRAGRHRPDGHLLYQPAARVFHRVTAERATWRYFRSRCFHEGRSKALVAALAGSRAGLSTERAYALQTLPQGVLRGLQAALLRREGAGLLRAAAIVIGLWITGLGYLVGQLPSGAAKPAPLSATVTS